LLLDEVKNDPVRKAGLVRDVVETIAKIPDPIIRSMYLKQSSAMMDIQESLLIAELNKIRRQQLKKDIPVQDAEELLPEILLPNRQQTEELSTEKNISDSQRITERVIFIYNDKTFEEFSAKK
jgi:DNA primase